MLVHIARIAGIALVLLTCLFLPFLPGDYDGLAAPLSTMAMLFGFAGLLLIPVGACWLIYEFRKSASGAVSHSDKGFYFALAAVIASLPVAAITTLGALVTLGFSAAALCLLALATFGVCQIVPRLRQLKSSERRRFNPAPIYLVVLPTVAVLFQYAFGERAAEYSRNRAISNCEPLIRDIEIYRQHHGRYPASLSSVWADYKPSVMGVKRFHYEPSGEAYNVYFEQFSFAFGTREFLMYNKLDEQVMTSHNMDLLRMTPEELNIQRGYYAVYNAGPTHWKRFLFD